MKKKKGFTLVELLAVIVILAVILVIAVPQIMSVIESARKGSIESTAKLIAEGAEREYTNRKILGKDTNIKCSDVSSMNSNDYGTCVITFDNRGKATVKVTGKGKFEGYTCNGNSTNMECTKGPTDASYFSYNEVVDEVIVKDKNKCVAYYVSKDETEENANTLCNGNALDDGLTLKQDIQGAFIPSSDYETAGLEVTCSADIIITGYNSGFKVEVEDKDKCVAYLLNVGMNENIVNLLCTGEKYYGNAIDYYVSTNKISKNDYETAGLEVTYENGGGSDVVIPSEIDGKKVVGIADYAFSKSGIVGISIPSMVKSIGESAFAGNPLTSATISNGVTSIGDFAFKNNQLTSIIIPSSVTSIGINAFADNQLTSLTILNGVESIGNYAFLDNKLTEVTIPSSVTDIGKGAFRISCNVYSTLNGCTKVTNENLSKIVNKTGRSFDWDAIINDPMNNGRYTFETGSVSSINKANWNVEITK